MAVPPPQPEDPNPDAHRPAPSSAARTGCASSASARHHRAQPTAVQPRSRANQEGRPHAGARYNIFTLWANDVHSLGNYAFAIGPVRPRPGRLADPAPRSASAPAFLFVLLTLSGYMGNKTGVPFPVMSRIASASGARRSRR